MILKAESPGIFTNNFDIPSEPVEPFSRNIAQRRREIYEEDSGEKSGDVKVDMHRLDVVPSTATDLSGESATLYRLRWKERS